MTANQANDLIAALAPFNDPDTTTPDERTAAEIVRHACEDILAGGNLNPPGDGEPHKLRLVRRVDVSFFHPNAPRPATVTAP